jgi:hypothetical protein
MPWVHYTPFTKQKQKRENRENRRTSAIALIKEIPLHEPAIGIWEAVRAGDTQALNYHLATAENAYQVANSVDSDLGYTLLYSAVLHQANNIDLLRVLLHYGADVDVYTGYNVQAIHSIALHSQDVMEQMRLFLDYGCNPNALDTDHWTPLHYVTRFTEQPMEVIKMLVQRGAKLNAKDINRKSPAFGLLANGDLHTELEWMLEHGALPHIHGMILDVSTGLTTPGSLLVQAAKYSRINCINWLLANIKWPASDITQAIKVAESRTLRSTKTLKGKNVASKQSSEKSDRAARATLLILQRYQQDTAAMEAEDNDSILLRKISLKLSTRQ